MTTKVQKSTSHEREDGKVQRCAQGDNDEGVDDNDGCDDDGNDDGDDDGDGDSNDK